MTCRSSSNSGLRLAAALAAAAPCARAAAEGAAPSPLDTYLAEAAPRRFADLTPAERAALLRDPRLRDYLAARAATAAARDARPAAIALPPGEALRPGPWRAPLPGP
ncbi:MAG TPA: hypothetical protein VHC86_12535 [Opitutaceae bacterium]|nr:hypothetical protein [Opitutaceae bacterium]